MAANGSSGNRDGLDDDKLRDVRHTCSHCMERYGGERKPKILPCFHTFCLLCLTALQASVTTAKNTTRNNTNTSTDTGDRHGQRDDEKDDACSENNVAQASDDVTAGGDVTATDNVSDGQDGDKMATVFCCPTCRAPVSVPKGGVASLQTNFYVDHERGEEDASPPTVLCGMCDEEGEQQQPATHHCRQCHVAMCRTCRRYHDKLMPKHHVTAVGAGQPAKEKQETKRVCLVHQDQVLCFYCGQCEIALCLHCKLTSHEGHDTLDLATAALQSKREVAVLITTAQQQLQVMDSALQQMDREDLQLTRHAQKTTQEIHARCDALRTWACESRDQLLEDVSGKAASDRRHLAGEKASLTPTRDALSSLLTQAARATASDPHVVMVKNELKAALLADRALDQHKKRGETKQQQRSWGWRYDVADASVLYADDIRSYMGRVVDGGLTHTDVITAPLSVRQLADRVDRWMNETAEATNAITSKLKTCEDKVETLQKKEGGLTKETASLSGQIKTLQNKEVGLTKERASLSSQIKTLQNKEDELKKKAASLSDDIIALQKKEAELKKQTASLNDDMKTSRKAEDELRKTTQSLVQKLDKTAQKVSFTALSIDTSRTSDRSPIVFKRVLANVGNCYSDTTGEFKATVPGCYIFTATIGSGKSDDRVLAHIVVDDTEYTYIRGSYTSEGCGSISVVLRKGQKVWVKANSNKDHYCSSEMCFTGALVQPQP